MRSLSSVFDIKTCLFCIKSFDRPIIVNVCNRHTGQQRSWIECRRHGSYTSKLSFVTTWNITHTYTHTHTKHCCFSKREMIQWPASQVVVVVETDKNKIHIDGMYGQLKLEPDRSISRMSVSIGVLPTSRTKKSCSMTCDETVRRDGSRRSNLPKRTGWLAYCVRQYSSRAHCDFSCKLSMCATSDNPQASVKINHQK